MLLQANAALAQESRMQDRLDKIERDLNLIQRQVYRGKSSSRGDGGGDLPMPSSASLEVRLSEIEEQQRRIVGKIEEAEFQARQANQAVEALSKDVDFRFKELEGLGAGTKAAALSAVGKATRTPVENPKVSELDSEHGIELGGERNLLDQKPGQGAAVPTKTDAQQAYDDAFDLLRETKYDEAGEAFLDFIKQHPNSPLVSAAYYWAGETFYVQKDYSQSALQFLRGYQKAPKGSKAADSLLKLGLSLSQLGKKKEACDSLTKLAKEFPNASSSIKQRASSERSKLGCL